VYVTNKIWFDLNVCVCVFCVGECASPGRRDGCSTVWWPGYRSCFLISQSWLWYTPLRGPCIEDQCGVGVVAYPHHLGSARQEVQEPVAQGSDEFGGHYGVRSWAVVDEQHSLSGPLDQVGYGGLLGVVLERVKGVWSPLAGLCIDQRKDAGLV
jgi:hypothetical protein